MSSDCLKQQEVLAAQKGIIRIPNHLHHWANKNGNIYSSKTGKLRKLTPHDDHRGYLICHVTRDDRTSRSAKVHHLILETFIGPKPSDLHVGRHLNDDSWDNRLENLAWGTIEENKLDKKNNLNNKQDKLLKKFPNKNKTSEVKKEILLRVASLCTIEELAVLSGWNSNLIQQIIDKNRTMDYYI